jgi:DNA polymerase-1
MRETTPTHALVVFESGGDGGRRSRFPAYKANREPPDEQLLESRRQARTLVKSRGIAQIEHAEFEADDLIAAYTHLATSSGWAVVIASHDKDLAQLVTNDVLLYRSDPRLWGPDVVVSQWGVPPAQLGDLLALQGDATDNLKVVRGCGKKTAPRLLHLHGSLEGILAAAARGDKSITPKLREELVVKAEDVRIIRDVIRLRQAPTAVGIYQLARPEDRSEVL